MAIRVIDDSKLQDIAVAIQGKDGGDQMTVDEMPTRITAIPTRDNTTLNSLIDRSITGIENDEVTSIGTYSFSNCTNLTSASFPNVTSIGTYSFQNCTNLTSVSLPNVTSIGVSAFYSCTNLTSASFPNVTSIGTNAFRTCTNLTSVSLPNVTSIGVSAFYSCTNLSIVILGKRATLSNSNAFAGADNAITYVQPEDLSWYSTATNWSALYTAGRVKSIEELPT